MKVLSAFGDTAVFMQRLCSSLGGANDVEGPMKPEGGKKKKKNPVLTFEWHSADRKVADVSVSRDPSGHESELWETPREKNQKGGSGGEVQQLIKRKSQEPDFFTGFFLLFIYLFYFFWWIKKPRGADGWIHPPAAAAAAAPQLSIKDAGLLARQQHLTLMWHR